MAESLLHVIRGLGGVAATHELLRRGYTGRQLTAVVNLGFLMRPRQGWYVPAGTSDDVVRAIRVGGRLASWSAAASYGLATPERFPLHVHVKHADSRLRAEFDKTVRLAAVEDASTVVIRGTVDPVDIDTRWRVSVLDCLYQVVSREREEDAVACVDSALHIGLVDLIDRELLRRRVPQRRRHLVDVADHRSESYPESIVRYRLAASGIQSEPQVGVLGERWVDLLVGDRLAIEIDGMGKYTENMTRGEVAKKVHGDRVRDAFLEALGYHVVRLSYRMIMDDWPATLSAIQAVIERGDHLARPKYMHSRR